MSRCFPFPPPGYELKGRLDDVNVIVKEKHNKKEKKERKESERKEKKEKKERSERKEKERGEDKHKEGKKRKREKHRDKKDKNKDKVSSSGEKKSVESSENQNGPKLVPDNKLTVRIQDKRTVVELGNRVRNDGATSSQMVQKITIVEKEKANLLGKVPESGNGMLAIKDKIDHSRMANGMLAIKDKRTVVELANRVRNDGAMSSQMVQKITIVEKEKANLLGKVPESGNGMLAIKDKIDHRRMANGQSFQIDSRSLGSERNFYGEKKIKVEERKERNGNGHIVGKGDGSKNEDQNKNTKAEDKKRKEEIKKGLKGLRKDKVKQETSNGNFLDFHSNIPSDLLKENDDRQGKLPKLKELNGFLHAKDIGVRPNNMSRPVVASHQAAQNGSVFHPSQNTINLGVGKRAVITDQKVNGKLSSPQSVIDNVRNIGPCQTANSTKSENGRVNINNRLVSNGVISPHIVRIERKMEPCQTSNNLAMAKQIINRSADGKVPSSHPLVDDGGKTVVHQTPEAVHKKMHNKESMMNGSLDSKNHSSSMPSSASLKRKEKVVATMKAPHPDLKYLSQILTVPEVEWPQSDDQEWLFDHKGSETKRAKLASPEIQWTKQVWSEAVHLESADVTALPYVIPY